MTPLVVDPSRIVAGAATFLHHDAIAAMRQMREAGQRPDLILTSPPYNLGKEYGSSNDELTYRAYLEWTEAWLDEAYTLLPDGGRLCLNLPVDTTQRHAAGHAIVLPLAFDVQAIAHDLGFHYQTTIDWCEGNIGRRTAWGSYGRPSAPFVTNPNERILVLYKGDRWKRVPGDRTWDLEPEQFKAWTLGSWAFPGASAKREKHPAPFPEELPRRLILLYSFREDVILDPFVGSGTTCRVANRLGRVSYGIDIHRPYLEAAAESITNDLATIASGVRYLQTTIEMPVSSDEAVA
jgi:site-specific DNA-methyltransferase (adenine-specific)